MDDRRKLIKLREEIATLKSERLQVAGARVDFATALGRVRRYVEHLGRGYAPRVTAFMGHEERSPPDLITRGEPGEFLAWAIGDTLSARLEAELRELYAGVPLALSSEERIRRLADLDARLLAAEREEEDVVCKLLAEGIDVSRRVDADVRVLLDVQ